MIRLHDETDVDDRGIGDNNIFHVESKRCLLISLNTVFDGFEHMRIQRSFGKEKPGCESAQVDKFVPRLLDLASDFITVTGDHSTPSTLKSHSWHPVPLMLWSRHCRPDKVDSSGERACMDGGFGPNFPAVNIMPLALANAQRLNKFGD